MAYHCSFCDTRRPVGDTKMLIDANGIVEICPPCGELPDMVEVADHPEVTTLNQLFELNDERE